MKLKDLNTPVLQESKVLENLKVGAWIEIKCEKDASKKGSSYSGEWKLQVCNQEDGELARAVVVKTKTLEHRKWLTVHGLVSFALQMGILGIEIPLENGRRGIWRHDQSHVPAGYVSKDDEE